MTQALPTATEPSANARTMAALMWDHFRALTQVGFTEAQALSLLGCWLGTLSSGYQGDRPEQR